MKINKKKQTPLSVLQALEPYIDKKGNNFISTDSDEDLIRFIDIDPESDFYFYIKQYQVKSQFQVLIEYKPHNSTSVEKRQLWIKGNEIKNYFTSWINLLTSYEKVKSPFDDPIIESFKNDYFTDFELIDEDSDKPLKPDQILLLDEYFENVENRIDVHLNEKNTEEIREIKTDIKELRENLSNNTKTWIVTKICWIWAKMTKLGPKLMRDFIDEGNKQIVKEGVKQLLEIGKNLIT